MLQNEKLPVLFQRTGERAHAHWLMNKQCLNVHRNNNNNHHLLNSEWTGVDNSVVPQTWLQLSIYLIGSVIVFEIIIIIVVVVAVFTVIVVHYFW